MIRRYNGEYLRSVSGLTFRGISSTFPFSVDNTNGAITMYFTESITVTVDYGNGVTISYPNRTMFELFTNPTQPPNPHVIYNYPDGQVKERTVKITYDKGKLFSYRQVSSIGMYPQPFLFEFGAHPKLQIFQVLNSSFATNVDVNTVTSSSNPLLTSIDIRFFHTSSDYYSKIPANLLSLPLSFFSFGNNTYLPKTDAETNMDKIVQAKNTLVNLQFNDISFNDSRLPPDNWAQLINLTVVNANNCTFSTIPASFRAWTKIQNISMGLGATLSSFDGFQNWTDLRSFNMSTQITQLDPEGYFNQLILFKTISAVDKLTTAIQCTTFVTNWYNFVSTHAPKTGNSASPFRYMTVNISKSTSGPANVVIPDGIYKEPDGYIAGSFDGYPVSSMERIWLLVNQYQHIWYYRVS